MEYSPRRATDLDAEKIAMHRALMFLEMGAIAHQEISPLVQSLVPWFQRQLAKGEYFGWLIEVDGVIASGAGVHLREQAPGPHLHKVGQWGHIANVYTEPQHRRKGLAAVLMRAILRWCAEEGLDHVTLVSSEAGKPLYESLGFVSVPEMELPLHALNGYAAPRYLDRQRK